MSDAVPYSIAGPFVMAMAAAMGAVWRSGIASARQERLDCKERVDAIEERVAVIEKKREDCEERWRREVDRGVELATHHAAHVPTELPPPDWDEPTETRLRRADIEQAALSRASERRGRKALVIDDDEDVASAIHRMVRSTLPDDWQVEHVTDARRGLAALVLNDDVTLAFVDLRMPRLDGISLIEEALTQRPELRGRIVVCTAIDITAAQERRLFSDLACIPLRKSEVTWRMRAVINQAFRAAGRAPLASSPGE